MKEFNDALRRLTRRVLKKFQPYLFLMRSVPHGPEGSVKDMVYYKPLRDNLGFRLRGWLDTMARLG